MSGFVGIRFELGQSIQTSYNAAGFLVAQHDGLGQNPKVGSSEVLYPLGFLACPRDPDVGPDGKALDGGGCKLLIYRDGTEFRVEFKGDQRALERTPPLKPGSAIQYADTGKNGPISIDVQEGDDGSKHVYVERGGSAHILFIGTDANGEELIELTHADGMGVRLYKKGAILRNADGDCYVEVHEDGKGVLNGNFKLNGDITDATGISLLHHTHLTPLGPSGPPLPSL